MTSNSLLGSLLGSQILSDYLSCTLQTTLEILFPPATHNMTISYFPQHNLPPPSSITSSITPPSDSYDEPLVNLFGRLIAVYPYEPGFDRLKEQRSVEQAGGGAGFGWQYHCFNNYTISEGSGGGAGYDKNSTGGGGGGGTQIYKNSELISTTGRGGGCGSENGGLLCGEKKDDYVLNEDLEIECEDYVVYGGGGGGGGYDNGVDVNGYGYGFSFTVTPLKKAKDAEPDRRLQNENYIQALKKYNPTGLMFVNASKVCGGYDDWGCVCRNVQEMGGLDGVDCNGGHSGHGDGNNNSTSGSEDVTDNQSSGKDSHPFDPRLDLPSPEKVNAFCNALTENEFCGLGSIGVQISGCDVSLGGNGFDLDVPTAPQIMGAGISNPDILAHNSNNVAKDIIFPSLALVGVLLTFVARRSLRMTPAVNTNEGDIIVELEITENSRLITNRRGSEIYI